MPKRQRKKGPWKENVGGAKAGDRRGDNYRLKERVEAAQAYVRGYFVRRREDGTMERVPATLRSLGERYGVSHERIRQWLHEQEIQLRDPGFRKNGNRESERVLKPYNVELVRKVREVVRVEAYNAREAAAQARRKDHAVRSVERAED